MSLRRRRGVAAAVPRRCRGVTAASLGVDTTALARVAQDIGKGLREHKDFPVVVIRSTVFPDVVENVVIPRLERASERKLGEGFGLVINPEFLREGTAIADFEEPQYTLIGTDEPRSAEVMRRMYAFLDAPFLETDRRSASIIKYACNCFHGLKVAFANEIATVSRAAGADAQEVMRIFCEDEKLNCSKAYLRPGMPFGGSCLPKDLRAAVQYGRRADLMLPVLNAALTSNRLQTQACSNLILSHGRGRVGVFGMSFTAGTDDLRESPAMSIALEIAAIHEGSVLGIEPNIAGLPDNLDSSLVFETTEQALLSADIYVLLVDHREFRRFNPTRAGKLTIDTRGIWP